jgi:hypothetical protein
MLDTDWHVIGASVTGTTHLRRGQGCDDAHAYRVHGHDLLIIAVADGAGSASRAAIGAMTAVQTAIDAAERILFQQIEPAGHNQWLSVLNHILSAARESLVRLIGERRVAAHDLHGSIRLDSGGESSLGNFATTLLIAIVTVHWIAIAQIGDGAVVIQYSDGSIQSVTPGYCGEYINETYFLTDVEYLALADYKVLPRTGIQGIALLTDGLQLMAMHFPKNTPHQPFFAPLFKFAASLQASSQELQRFLASEQVCLRTDDDKTLILAVYQ